MIFHRIPALEHAGIKRGVNGAIGFAPDGRPTIEFVPGVPGICVACGFLGGIGLAISQLILTGESQLDWPFIDVVRFGDWATRECARARTHQILPIRCELIYPGTERKTGRLLKTTPIYIGLLSHGAVTGQTHSPERPLWYAPGGETDEPSFQSPNWWVHVSNEARAMARRCDLPEISSWSCRACVPALVGPWLVFHPSAFVFQAPLSCLRLASCVHFA